MLQLSDITLGPERTSVEYDGNLAQDRAALSKYDGLCGFDPNSLHEILDQQNIQKYCDGVSNNLRSGCK